MVLDNPVPTEAARGCSWYMAEALLHGDPGKIVPVESLERVPPTLKAVAWKALGEFYPDQEIIWAVANRGVNPGSWSVPKQTVLGTNHASGLKAHQFVHKANNTEKNKGHLFGFPISVSPPIYPAVYSPTGAVHKKLRDGSIDPQNMRPTLDLSWPPPGYWMAWLTQSTNDSIDEDSLPIVHYLDHQNFKGQIMQLKELGEEVL